MADIPPYPLYNRTYSLYRLSPLHHGAAVLLADGALRTHAKRLREQLKGDAVRGVQVDFAGAEDTARLGPLEACSWDLLGDEDAWIDGHDPLQHDAEASALRALPPPSEPRGIEVRVEYETQSYQALLLRDPRGPAAPDGFSSLPLLLLKMPGAVRDVFLQYLRTAFDAHVAPLRLPSAFITASIETCFRHLSASTSTQTIAGVVGQLSVQLAFPTATTLLRHVDLTIAAADVPGFVARGTHARDRPFTAALSDYLAAHLALDVSHPAVQVSRIACNAFHLGTERLKLAAPDPLAGDSPAEGGASQDASAGQLAVEELVTSLIREAAGSGRFLPGTATKKRAVSSAPAPGGSKRARSKSKRNGRRDDADEDVETQHGQVKALAK
ncbi:uncharacterized protein M421DRAFT_419235 [Didymella exigua CBS 183.55]|uniref:Uncharacterized protein n=1 Tax=Didymella exigua CBS 183.55 TaxID=1150837 RepID=A0A6A5RSU3_9PLEO|nr:uncharacterized protein M421DRAFT_419235 [Didymella exigua CBS 183.55]KAF1930184.1 hypothetical protein M421DRAFT_419235 [Didymella exigua CBS 183.55]